MVESGDEGREGRCFIGRFVHIRTGGKGLRLMLGIVWCGFLVGMAAVFSGMWVRSIWRYDIASIGAMHNRSDTDFSFFYLYSTYGKLRLRIERDLVLVPDRQRAWISEELANRNLGVEFGHNVDSGGKVTELHDFGDMRSDTKWYAGFAFERQHAVIWSGTMDHTDTNVVVPYWFLVLASGAWPAWRLFRHLQKGLHARRAGFLVVLEDRAKD